MLFVSGCSDFACGLMRFYNDMGPSVGIMEGSRVAISRVGGLTPSRVVLSPNPNCPGSTKVYRRIVGRLTKRFPVLNVYLNRRTVYRICNTAVSRTVGLVRNGGDSVVISASGGVFGKLPGIISNTECRSLVTGESAIPSALRMVTRSHSNRIVKIGRGSFRLCKLRFRPRSVLASRNVRVVGGFVALYGWRKGS